MKNSFYSVLLIGLAIFFAVPLHAQNSTPGADKKKHKIVFQLTNGDTLVHKALVKQIGHVLEAAPNSQIEVVCHSGGLPFLVAAQTRVAGKIKELKGRGVVFNACENTMRDRNVKQSDLVPESGTVPSGIVEIIKKQEKGWSYIKAGF
ncbi:MAG: DsrE family protein [Lewinellaceae bacterium]|nr:DsrE family protein [Lewinellaceae bacterium]